MEEHVQQKITIDVSTPDRVVLSTECTKIVAYGELGQFTVLPGHTRFASNLRVSELEITEEGSDSPMLLFVSGGILNVENNTVKVFAPSSEKSEEIDIQRAEAAKDRAEKKLDKKTEDIDADRAEFALQRALVRLQLAQKSKGRSHG